MTAEQEMRKIRNLLLINTDWTQIPDCSLSSEKKQEYIEYRQTLRDLPANSQPKYENNQLVGVVFPVPPK